MCQGEYGHQFIARVVAHFVEGEAEVGPHAPVREYDALGYAGGAGGVVYHGGVVRLFPAVDDVVRGKTVLEFFFEKFVYLFSDLVQQGQAAVAQGIVFHANDAVEAGHVPVVQRGPVAVAYEEEAGSGVVDDVVYVVGFEFVQDGDGNGSVRQGGDEGDAPVGAVAAAQADFVAFPYAGVFEPQAQFFHFPGYVAVGVADAFVVGEGGKVPVCFYAVFQQSQEAFFHDVSFCRLFYRVQVRSCFSVWFRLFWNLVVTQAVKMGKNIIPAAARVTAKDWPSFVTPKMLEPTVVTFMSDQLKASQ